MSEEFRIGFAGDRDVAAAVLEFLLAQGDAPHLLLVSDPARATHAEQLKGLCTHLPPEFILEGAEFRSERGLAVLRDLDLDVVVSIHFPYIVPAAALSATRLGWLNLHPAYLPYNRGWHTTSWAIIDGTPAGATLHFMDEGLDTGPIVARRGVPVDPADTANSLYRKVKRAEVDLFESAWHSIVDGTAETVDQDPDEGTAHRQADLAAVSDLAMDAEMTVGDVLDRLRALTTSNPAEAATFAVDDRRFRVRVDIEEVDG